MPVKDTANRTAKIKHTLRKNAAGEELYVGLGLKFDEMMGLLWSS